MMNVQGEEIATETELWAIDTHVSCGLLDIKQEIRTENHPVLVVTQANVGTTKGGGSRRRGPRTSCGETQKLLVRDGDRGPRLGHPTTSAAVNANSLHGTPLIVAQHPSGKMLPDTELKSVPVRPTPASFSLGTHRTSTPPFFRPCKYLIFHGKVTTGQPCHKGHQNNRLLALWPISRSCLYSLKLSHVSGLPVDGGSGGHQSCVEGFSCD